jgi:hypothetical protein
LFILFTEERIEPHDYPASLNYGAVPKDLP